MSCAVRFTSEHSFRARVNKVEISFFILRLSTEVPGKVKLRGGRGRRRRKEEREKGERR
jgi:hypothetical protein